MEKAAVFRVGGSDGWMSLDYCPTTKPYSLADRDGLLKFVPRDSPSGDDTIKMGWQKTSQGYRFYFKMSADDAIRVADNGGDLKVGPDRDTDITFALIKYNRPATFGWESRPRLRDGDRVENGNKVILSANYRRTTAVAGTGGYRSDLVTEYVTKYKPNARWLAVFSNSPVDQIVWTVHKSPKDNIELTAHIDRKDVYLSSVLESNRTRCAMDDNISWRDCSTGWEINPKGYRLFFESHPDTAVSHDCIIQEMKDAPPLYFTLDPYHEVPPEFDWKDRPYTTDGLRVEQGDQVRLRVNGRTLQALKTDEGDWSATPFSFKVNGPEPIWTFRKAEDGAINLECSFADTKLTWCTVKREIHTDSVFRAGPPALDASTRWTKMDAGYMVHFESRKDCPLYWWRFLGAEKSDDIAYFTLERVK